MSGIDMSQPALLAETDAHRLTQPNLARCCGYTLQAVIGKGSGDRIV